MTQDCCEETTFRAAPPQLVKVRVPSVRRASGRPRKPRKLTFHYYPASDQDKLKRGDLVTVKAGNFVEREGTVIRKRSRWKGYTYEVDRAPTRSKLIGSLRWANTRLASRDEQIVQLNAQLERTQRKLAKCKKKRRQGK